MSLCVALSVLLLTGLVSESASKAVTSLDDLVAGIVDSCVVRARELQRDPVMDRLDSLLSALTDRQSAIGEEVLHISSNLKQLTNRTDSGLRRVEERLRALEERVGALSAPEECPAGWSRHGRSCFLLPPDQTASWFDAEDACGRLGPRARLASVHPASSRHVHGLVAASPAVRVWVGLNRLPDVPQWSWTDGSPVDYFDWMKPGGQPDNSGGVEFCGQIMGPNIQYDGWKGWNDGRCDQEWHFLCQINLD